MSTENKPALLRRPEYNNLELVATTVSTSSKPVLGQIKSGDSLVSNAPEEKKLSRSPTFTLSQSNGNGSAQQNGSQIEPDLPPCCVKLSKMMAGHWRLCRASCAAGTGATVCTAATTGCASALGLTAAAAATGVATTLAGPAACCATIGAAKGYEYLGGYCGGPMDRTRRRQQLRNLFSPDAIIMCRDDIGNMQEDQEASQTSTSGIASMT